MTEFTFTGEALSFGTDGVRGVAGSELTAEFALRLGQAAASWLEDAGQPVSLVIGRDTRRSGTLLEEALAAGVMSAGGDVFHAGVLPTPALAFLVRSGRYGAAAVISASHNPAEHNGIKFFSSAGYKLSVEAERELEQRVIASAFPRSGGAAVGEAAALTDAADRYIEHLEETAPSLRGLRIALDCAHGAVSAIAPRLLTELGAEVTPVGCKPNGLNINLGCGATHPEFLQATMRSGRFDIGLSHDGDGDRVIAVDERGELIDGDFILAICAAHLVEKGGLPEKALVATVMSNLGFRVAMAERDIRVLETPVGDRFVLEEMIRSGVRLGGEQSGHLIFLDHTTTGDGLLSGLQLLRVMTDTGRPLSELAQVMQRFPQELINVRVRNKEAFESSKRLLETIAQEQKELGERGRVLVRPSGTEPLLRVMVEADSQERAKRAAERIAEVALDELGGDAGELTGMKRRSS